MRILETFQLVKLEVRRIHYWSCADAQIISQPALSARGVLIKDPTICIDGTPPTSQ